MNNNVRYFENGIQKPLPKRIQIPDGHSIYYDTKAQKITLQAPANTNADDCITHANSRVI